MKARECPNCGTRIEPGARSRCPICRAEIPHRGPVFREILAARARARADRETERNWNALRVLAILGWLVLALYALFALLLGFDSPSAVITVLIVPTALLAGVLVLSIRVDRVRAARRSESRHLGTVIDTDPGARVQAYRRLGTPWELAHIVATVVLAAFAALLGYALLRLVMSLVGSAFR